LFFHPANDEGDLFVEPSICGVEPDGVVGPAKGRHVALSVLSIALANLLSHIVHRHPFSAIRILFTPPPRPLVQIGIHEDLDIRLRKDDRTGVSPVEDHPAGLPLLPAADAPLQIDEFPAHGRELGDPARHRSHLSFTNAVTDVLTTQEDALLVALIPDFNPLRFQRLVKPVVERRRHFGAGLGESRS
jgi:hypothetical protein